MRVGIFLIAAALVIAGCTRTPPPAVVPPPPPSAPAVPPAPPPKPVPQHHAAPVTPPAPKPIEPSAVTPMSKSAYCERLSVQRAQDAKTLGKNAGEQQAIHDHTFSVCVIDSTMQPKK